MAPLERAIEIAAAAHEACLTSVLDGTNEE
jgi:hypothetical protein